MKTINGKRALALVLVLVLFIGLAPYLDPEADADAYEPRTSLPDNARSSIKYYCVDSSLGYGNYNPYTIFSTGNCTWYAFGRAWELLGYYPSKLVFTGDACSWFDANKNNFDSGNGGFPYSTDPNAPALGAVACWSKDGKGSSGGHVAVVEQISDNSDGSKTILTSESGYASYYYKTVERNTSTKGLGWASYTFQGYIYIMGTPSTQSGDTNIYCTVTSPTENEVLSKAAHPVIGSITSGRNIKQVTAYIDGDKYADFNVDTTYVALRSTDVNNKLDFASLEPGYHSLIIYARNSSNSTLKSVLVRSFYINPGEHTHLPSSYCGYYEAHPHYKIYECTLCGQQWYDPEDTYRVKECRECNRPLNPVMCAPYTSTKNYSNAPVEFTWYEPSKYGNLTTHYNMWLYKLGVNGAWETYEHTFYVESGIKRTLPAGEYRFVIQAYNSNWYEEDGSDWLHSESECRFTVIDADACEFTGHRYVNNVCTKCGQPNPEHVMCLSYSGANVENADSYTVKVYIKDNIGFSRFSIPIEVCTNGYKHGEGCKLFKVECGDLIDDLPNSKFEVDYDSGTIVFNNPTDITGDGELFKVTIKVLDSAKTQLCWLDFTGSDADGDGYVDIAFYNSLAYKIWAYEEGREFITFETHTHSYSATVTEPTCTEGGYTTYTCSCGDSHTGDNTYPLGHNYVKGVCTRCGDIKVNRTIGDLNGDGDITSADSVLVSRYLADLEELTDEQLIAADVNGDGDVTSADAVMLARFLAGLIPSLT